MIDRAAAEAPDLVVLADMEAGLEHLSWAGGTLAHVDLLLVVAEPRSKSLVTAARTHALATELGIAEVAVVGNRVADGQAAAVEEFAADRALEVLALLPEDDAVRRADQAGVSVVDHAPTADVVTALTALAGLLDARGLSAASLAGRPAR